MTPSDVDAVENKQEEKLRRRDGVLLPALGLLTLLLLAGSPALLQSWLFPTSQHALDSCFVKGDSTGEAPVVPNSVCSEQTVESQFPAEYRFNRCGDRAGMDCGPKTAGTYRIVMIGSSMAMGLFVPRDRTFAALLSTELSQRTGRRIELYNKATGGKFRGGSYPGRESRERFDQVLAADPDMILWIVTPADVANMTFADPGAGPPPIAPPAPPAPAEAGNRLTVAAKKLAAAVVNGTLLHKIGYRWNQSHSALLLKHLLYESESQSQYVTSYLKNEDGAEFLKDEPGAPWQGRWRQFQEYAADIELQARSAGVPLVGVLVPNRAQSAMISLDEWPAGYDPYRLDQELRALIVSHGGTYLDILPDFRRIAHPEQKYFPVDGHLDAAGHAMIAGMLTEALTSGAVPELRAAPVSK